MRGEILCLALFETAYPPHTMEAIKLIEKPNFDDKTALKKFLIQLYFKEHEPLNLEQCKLFLSYTDRSLLKRLRLPRSWFRKYQLVLVLGKKEPAINKTIPYHEKDAVKYFVNILNNVHK
jgi:hypothetical protein